jgi:hypothetical protein
MGSSDIQNVSALPIGVPISQVYADFLQYLLQHTQQFFEDHILDGKSIWTTYKPTMDVIIAHPNGWGVLEQTFLRTAAVAAGFTSIEQASNQVHFVTEAEASAHFCTHYTTLRSQLKVTAGAPCPYNSEIADLFLCSLASISPYVTRVGRRWTRLSIL